MKHNPLSLLFALSVVYLLSFCSLNEENKVEKPLIQTGLAQEVSECSAIITASINPALVDGDYEMGVIISTDSDCSKDNGFLGTTDELGSDNAFLVKFTELNANTTYYYKAFVKFSGVYHYGEVKSFDTKDISAVITVITGEYNDALMTVSAQVQVENNVSLPFSLYGFFISDKYSTFEELIEKGTLVEAVLDNRNDFLAKLYYSSYDTKYYYVAVVTLYGKSFYGEVKYFTTPEDLGEARITVNPIEITFGAGDEQQTVTLIATRDWRIFSQPEWVALDKTAGVASTKEQAVKISVEANKGRDREGELIFTIGLARASLLIKQTGEQGGMGTGTLEDPFSVAGVIKYVKGLSADVNSTEQFYVKGKISTITQNYTYNISNGNTYGNARFNISDDGSTTSEFICYNCYYLGNRKFTAGNTDIKINDDVIVCGPVVYYKGTTPEFVSNKHYLYSLNGKTQ